jgi:hypothetical protein
VIVRVSEKRAAAIFVDNDARLIYGQRYFSGSDLDKTISEFVSGVMTAIRAVHDRETQIAVSRGRKFPAAYPTKKKIKDLIIEKVQATDES